MICKNCGKEIDDKAVICVHCGCLTTDNKDVKEIISESQQSKKDEHYQRLGYWAKFFMILSCICYGFTIIPLLWMIPMTTTLSRKLQNNEEISVGFKICVFLFCNQISGVILLCMNN